MRAALRLVGYFALLYVCVYCDFTFVRGYTFWITFVTFYRYVYVVQLLPFVPLQLDFRLRYALHTTVCQFITGYSFTRVAVDSVRIWTFRLRCDFVRLHLPFTFVFYGLPVVVTRSVYWLFTFRLRTRLRLRYAFILDFTCGCVCLFAAHIVIVIDSCPVTLFSRLLRLRLPFYHRCPFTRLVTALDLFVDFAVPRSAFLDSLPRVLRTFGYGCLRVRSCALGCSRLRTALVCLRCGCWLPTFGYADFDARLRLRCLPAGSRLPHGYATVVTHTHFGCSRFTHGC